MPDQQKNSILGKLSSGYTYDQLFPLIRSTLDAGISVLLLGPPGIGKSTIAMDLARIMRKPMIDIRLAQKDPAELGGVYFPDRETQTLELFPPGWVKRACSEACFVFLDEFNAAVTKLHQAAAYQIVLERRIGDFRFHPGTVVMAAGNREEDNAIVSPLSNALCNRFAHIEMRPDVSAWIRWASANGIQEDIMAFIQTYGEKVLFAPSDGHAFPTPRSWAMASRVMSCIRDPDLISPAVASCIGQAMALRFSQYRAVYRKINASGIIEGKVKPDFAGAEPSFVYAAIFSVSGYLAMTEVTEKKLRNIVRFLASPGIGPEYQLLFLRQLCSRKAELFERLKALAAFRDLAGKIVNLRAAMYLS